VDLSEGLRLGMRRLVSGVCVISTRDENQRYAMTASSITSLSADPASLLVCVNKTAAIQPILTLGQAFAVNILSTNQEMVSNKCASKGLGEERFNEGNWQNHDSTNLPYLTDSQAIFFCEVDNDNYEYGTHQVVIGKIKDIIVPDISVDPLVYADGAYKRIS
jgi:flavin reductase (NADH)